MKFCTLIIPKKASCFQCHKNILSDEIEIRCVRCNIKLHNSLGANKDMKFHNTMLLTPKELFLITNESLKEYNINIKDYLKNMGDGLALKRKLLTHLRKINYKYIRHVNIAKNKNLCKHIQCSKIIWDYVKNKTNTNNIKIEISKRYN